MSYDPSDNLPEPTEMDPAFEQASSTPDYILDAVNAVIVNVFGEPWDEDDEERAIAVLCETYSENGIPWETVEDYADSTAPGYYFPEVHSITGNALINAGLIDDPES
jgi:hypothetical protein